jgi:hypothetical protein
MLFDLREDPTELRDVAGENGEVVGELGRLYEVWAVEVGV